MKKITAIAALSILSLSSVAQAESTIGLGVGGMYSGLGVNVGKRSSTSFTYASLGCQAYSYGYVDGSETKESESNCGVGLGTLSTSLFSSNKHAIGFGVDVSYNTQYSQNELRIRPGYYYFFNGIDSAGFNVGVGPNLYIDDNKSDEVTEIKTSSFLNVGYQF